MFGLFTRKRKPNTVEAVVIGTPEQYENLEAAREAYHKTQVQQMAESIVNASEAPKYIAPRYGYDDAIDAAAEKSAKMDSEIHWHLFKYANDNELIDKSEFRTSMNHMRLLYPKNQATIDAEIDRFCNPPQAESEEPPAIRPLSGYNSTITYKADQVEPSPPVESYPLPPGHVALKDPRFNLLSATPSGVVFARQLNSVCSYWFVQYAVEVGESSGLSPASIRQAKLMMELAPIYENGIHKVRPEDLDIPASMLEPVLDLEFEPTPEPTELDRLKTELEEKKREVAELVSTLRRIHSFAHDRSEDPRFRDALWEIREMAADVL